MQRFIKNHFKPHLLTGLMLALFWPCAAFGVEALFHVDSPQAAPFPSDRFTVVDSRQITNQRINLTKPECTANISECLDIDTLNELDGFNIQPRLSIPFDGPINPTTATSQTIFLVAINSIMSGYRLPSIIGINQIVWDPASNTLYAESDRLLEEHTSYALIVTDGVRDRLGNPVRPSQEFVHSFVSISDNYHRILRDILRALRAQGLTTHQIIAASVFTTMSVTPILNKIREQMRAAPAPASAKFRLGPGGSRTVFPVASLISITHHRQTTTAPAFVDQYCPLGAANPSRTIAFGRFRAPNFLAAERYIPQVGTRRGTPQILGQGEYDIIFILHLPAGPKPDAGWPVAIFGHGYQSNMLLSCPMQQEFTASGIAVIAFNAIGHGGGQLSTLKITTTTGQIEIAGVGRGEDRNHDGDIGYAEGMSVEGLQRLVGIRDGVRQTVAELMQLVRVIEVGLDVDGDGSRDLDPSRIYYFGHSNGGNYGTLFLAVEPTVRVGALVAPGTLIGARLSPVYRPLIASGLGQRVPSLLNAGADFNENIPLRDKPPVVNTVVGAMKLQEYFEREEWARQPGSSIAYASYLLPRGKKILVQFVMGDRSAPNPMTSALLRAGGLVGYATYLRWDIMLQTNPNVSWDSHVFILNMVEPRHQIATFFRSNGATIVDPDGTGQLWETPIVPPLPEDTNYFP